VCDKTDNFSELRNKCLKFLNMAETPQPGCQLLRDLATEGVVVILSQCARHSSCSSRSSPPDRCHRIDWLKEKASQAQQTEVMRYQNRSTQIYNLHFFHAKDYYCQQKKTFRLVCFLFLKCNLNRYDSVGSQRNKKSSNSDFRIRTYKSFDLFVSFKNQKKNLIQRGARRRNKKVQPFSTLCPSTRCCKGIGG
jgi:hypothetical protein